MDDILKRIFDHLDSLGFLPGYRPQPEEERFLEMERQIREQFGAGFLLAYQELLFARVSLEEEDFFRSGLRLGFALAAALGWPH